MRNRIRIQSDPLIFGLPDPDLDPLILGPPDADLDPSCNNGFIKLFTSPTKYRLPRLNKFKHKMMVYNIEFYAYLPKI